MSFIFSIALILCLSFSNYTSAADDEDPFDLSFYKKGAAIGDSYAAGIGAGNELAWSCARYDASYGNLVAMQLGVDEKDLDFSYTACSGAVVDDVYQQAKKLSSDQEFIMVSAGGNDAKLTGILNSCVFSFYGGLSHPDCDKTLDKSMDIIQGDKFASKLDDLLDIIKTKLSSDGNIYYTGYAKFFDASDNACDKVSWHVWLNLFTREYLTQDRRRKMNDLVEAMNKALSSAVERAGPKVHFIDYDDDVGATYGRYCQPGQDESGGRGANLRDLFFYQMKSKGTPMLEPPPTPPKDELKRREDDDMEVQPVNGTLSAIFGAMMQSAIMESGEEADDGDEEYYAALADDNANLDLEEEVDETIEDLEARKRSLPVVPSRHHYHRRAALSFNSTLINNKFSNSSSPVNRQRELGSKVSTGSNVSPASVSGPNTHMHFSNNTGPTLSTTSANDTSTNSSSIGTVVANSTHVMLRGGRPVQRQAFNVKKLVLSDDTTRVFHPTQNGHALIANLVLYQMAEDNAKRLGLEDSMPPQTIDSTGAGWPELPGAACSKDSSDTWSGRDAMISALGEFCSDVGNTHGSTGDLTSGTFNDGLDYMNISISWDSDDSVIGEHQCMSWLDVVTDGCSIPEEGGENFKHGGTIDSNDGNFNATLTIEPLVMRKIWDEWEEGGEECNAIDSLNYVDADTLQSNIDDFCAEAAKQDIAESGFVFTQTYNDGTPESVDLWIEWPTGPLNYQVFEEECTWYMNVLHNDCSPESDDNPMNWKHGGSIADHNGVTYTVGPTRTRPPPPDAPFGECHSPHKFPRPYYSVTVTGAGSLFTDWGRPLLKELRECGWTTAWTFEYFDEPAEDGTEWQAYGQIPLLIPPHCARTAVAKAAGFVNKNQC